MPKKCPPYTLKTGEITQSYTSVVTANPKRKQSCNRHTKFSNKTEGGASLGMSRIIGWLGKHARSARDSRALSRILAKNNVSFSRKVIVIPIPAYHFDFLVLRSATYYDSLKLSAHWEGEGSEQTSLSNLKIRLGVQFGEIARGLWFFQLTLTEWRDTSFTTLKATRCEGS